LKEEDIRPTHLITENQILLQRDIDKIIEKKDNFIVVPCPACDSKKFKSIFEKQNFNFVICEDCQTIFINPRPSQVLLNNFYENSECIKHWKNIFKETESIRRKEIFVSRAQTVVELAKKFHNDFKLLVDVGAGFGTFCEEIKKYDVFKKIVAIEPSHDLAEVCRSKNLEIQETFIEHTKLKNVSVLTNFELIEHLFNPKDFVVACKESLNKNGLFIITTPNVKGFDMITLGKQASSFQGPNHLNYFHPKSITILLERAGFEVLEILTPGKLDVEIVRKNVLTGNLNLDDYPFLKRIFLEDWNTLGSNFQKFLIDNKLSSHMWIVAKNRP